MALDFVFFSYVGNADNITGILVLYRKKLGKEPEIMQNVWRKSLVVQLPKELSGRGEAKGEEWTEMNLKKTPKSVGQSGMETAAKACNTLDVALWKMYHSP